MAKFESMTPEDLHHENRFDERAYNHHSSIPCWQEATDVEHDLHSLILNEGLITGTFSFTGSGTQDLLHQVMLGTAVVNTTERGEQ